MIREIKSFETYSVRNEVLRKGKPIETCYFDGDDAETTMHFGLEHYTGIIGVVSVYQIKNKLFDDEIQFQLRGMAILETYQQKGYGALLIERAEKYCFEKKASIIWFNAREKAVPFYKKNGYTIIGDSFEIENVGTHFVMFKII